MFFFNEIYTFSITDNSETIDFIGNLLVRIHLSIDSRNYFECRNSHPIEGVTSTPKKKAHTDTISLLLLGLFFPDQISRQSALSHKTAR